jgi:CHRD domain
MSMKTRMKRRTKFAGVLFTALLTMSVAPALADKDADKDTITARLSGFQETPLTISSPGSAVFIATIRADETAIDYVLTYRDLSSPVTQSHIHFGRPAISGGIVLFLCTNLTPPDGVPTPQACPDAPATITGTLTAANVIPLPDQGIDPGAAGFAEMIEAIRVDAAYANVHTTVHPGGEVRSRLRVDEDDEPHEHDKH